MVQTRRPPTAHDVAHRAGVSQSAVSRVFNGSGGVRPSTRDRVLAAAAELDYRPNLIARTLITRRSGMIGLAFGSLGNTFYPSLLEKLATRLQPLGYRVLLFVASDESGGDPRLEQIVRYQVDGLVLAATTMSSAVAEECRRAGIVAIELNRTHGDPSVPSVTGSNIEGGREIASLIARAGHARPAFIAGREDASTSIEREDGFRAELSARNLPAPLREVGAFDPDRTVAAMSSLMSRPDRPDAVFCASDHMALVAMDVARYTFGMRVPEDVSIIGFDDAPPAAWPSYRLTTYAQPVDEMVEATVTLLLDRIADPAAAPRRVVVPGRLMLRGSCRLPRDDTP